jgi:hypothetical protein
VAVVTLTENSPVLPPRTIGRHLERLGVRLIYQSDFAGTEFSEANGGAMEAWGDCGADASVLKVDGGLDGLVRTILRYAGCRYSSKVEIPAFQLRKEDYELIINADFLLQVNGRDSIIDLTGMVPEAVTILKDHQFSILSLSGGDSDPLDAAAKVLQFVEVPINQGPHRFEASCGEGASNISFILHGITFADKEGRTVLATALPLSEEVLSFLGFKGVTVLELEPFGPTGAAYTAPSD